MALAGLSLDALTRKVFPKFDHSDESELNKAVWEKLKSQIAECVEDVDHIEAKRLRDEDRLSSP
jgi:hypothetical protein